MNGHCTTTAHSGRRGSRGVGRVRENRPGDGVDNESNSVRFTGFDPGSEIHLFVARLGEGGHLLGRGFVRYDMECEPSTK